MLEAIPIIKAREILFSLESMHLPSLKGKDAKSNAIKKLQKMATFGTKQSKKKASGFAEALRIANGQ